MVFIDLEKAYDKVPRNVMWWALEKHKVPTKYITPIKDMYKDATTFDISRYFVICLFKVNEDHVQVLLLLPISLHQLSY